MRRRALEVVTAVLLAGGCSADRSFALVSVLSTGGQFNDVAQLRVEVDNATYHDVLTYPRAASSTTYRFDDMVPLTFSVSYRSSSHQGNLDVRVTTLDATGSATGFGLGSAPIDRNQVTKVPVLVTRGALPPKIDAGADAVIFDGGAPCDPSRPATACGAGQTCVVACRPDDSNVGMCQVAGSKPPGALCSDDCQQGSECFAFTCGGAPVRSCLRLCSVDADCGGEGRCVTAVPCGAKTTIYRTCSRPCDPVAPASSGCAPGLSCFLFDSELTDCDCVGAQRTGDDGAPCNSSDSCRPGLFCVSMGGAKACRPLCRLDGTSAPCAGGRVCAKLVDPAFTIYGACVP
jgi:hypothetical protein